MKKNSRTHVTSEMITSDAIASITLPSLGRMTSEKIVKTILAEVPAFSQPNKTVTPYDAHAIHETEIILTFAILIVEIVEI